MDANQNPGASLEEAPGEQDIQTRIPIRLTLEEIALLELLAEGFPYQEIAPRLAVSRATLKRRVPKRGSEARGSKSDPGGGSGRTQGGYLDAAYLSTPASSASIAARRRPSPFRC